MLAGLGRASLTADDYATAKYVDQTLDNTFPDSGAVRGFKRDYKAYRSPVFTTDLSFEHGNSALADNSFTSDSYLYSQPFGDNWRVFAHVLRPCADRQRRQPHAHGHRRRLPARAAHRAGRSHALARRGRTHGRPRIDRVRAERLLDRQRRTRFQRQLAAVEGVRRAHLGPLGERVGGVSPERPSRGQAELRREPHSDSNFHQEISATATQRVYTTATQQVNVSLDLGTDSNTRKDAPYFSPGRDYAAAATSCTS